MKTIAKIFLLSIVLLLATASCSKDRLNEDPDKDTVYSSLDDFYDLNQPQEQEFLIDSGSVDTITALEGTKIFQIPAQIFMKKSDHSDITYPYTLKLIEAYSIKHKIMLRQPGLAQGEVLHSGGHLKFSAFKNGDELELKEHCGLSFMAPSSAPTNAMELFYGFTAGTTDDWTNNVLNAGYLFANDDVTSVDVNSYGYNAVTAKTGWVGVARKFSGTADSKITFEAEGTNTDLIDIYIVFNNLKSYVKVSQMKANNLPVGESVTVFALAKSGNQMYYFKQNFTTGAPIHIELLMTPATENQIITIMDTL